MSHDSETDTASAGVVRLGSMIRAAYPRTAGVTLAAVEALARQETFTAAQAAYLFALGMDVGAQVRSAADRAELDASQAANFVPRPTREARVSLRSALMKEQAEIAWLRQYDTERIEWEGGDAESASARFGWDADRPDHIPQAEVSVRVREVGRGRYVWRDEA